MIMWYRQQTLLIQDKDNCRRVKLLANFQAPIKENYRCEFCDNCQPNLNFTNNKCEPLRFDLHVLDQEFKNWLSNSDILNIETAEFYIRTFSKTPINTYAKATGILDTSNPRNLKALYIARHFSGQDEKLKYSRRLLETANSRKSLDLE